VSGSPNRGTPRCRDERAAALVEFSIVFVLFAFICYALVAFGVAMNLKSNLTHAAAEGARTAVGAGLCDVNDPDAAVAAACRDTKILAAKNETIESVAGQGDKIKTVVEGLLEPANPANPNVVIAQCPNLAATAQCITVKIPYSYGDNPIVPSAPGLGVVLPSTLNANAVVQLTN
jgi:hypothetical protein